MKKLRKEIAISVKNRKINVFFLFLFMSFGILILTKLSKEYTSTVTFNINKINVPKEVVVLSDSTKKLNVTLKTHGFKWLKYYFSKSVITIDFSKDVSKTPSVFVWDKSKLYQNGKEQFGDNIEILSISPDKLEFSYDRNSTKKVPVILNSEIEFASGFDMDGVVVLKPDSVVVIGPEVAVSKIDTLQTEKMNLKDVKGNISQPVRLKLPNSSKDLNFSVNQVQVSANVEKFTEGTVKVPVNLVNVPEDITLNYFPKEVNVTFYTSLKHFNSVLPKDFKVTCDYKTLENGQGYLLPKLTKQSKWVKSAKVNQQHIEFIILE
ncbi:YbbR-like domain-containing protein [Flavobacteriaceae bacterium XHP0103]|nr:YbbR-like domain-containing protein [Marixanthotalea marina]